MLAIHEVKRNAEFDSIAHENSDKSLTVDEDCNETFAATLEENLHVVENYPGGTADSYMWKIGGSLKQPITQRQGSPVLVTAISSQYFPLLFGLVKSYHGRAVNRVEGVKIDFLIYDIGMTKLQRNLIKDSGMPFEIRKFPFDQFPTHVKALKYMAWKPIIIQILLMEFGFVWWVDSSVRFKTLDVENVFWAAKRYGLLFNIFPEMVKRNLTKTTDARTFKYLGEDSCKFRNFHVTDANSVLIYFNSVTRVLIRAWTRCALDKNCIAPHGSKHCDVSAPYTGSCHNYDKSVLGLLTSRVYHKEKTNSFMKVLSEVIIINRTDTITNNCKNDVCEF
ncbi:uncharacterized protein LOC132743170 [Ruditapes philippinarum]|uniref:uncharacterized protein LOC132743170 n=1 Tax=Ruditapes philippinarum TaxID=129788 RepID=UPI00295BC1C4|nr:uncharacterized protein LOC132743170 [Ruditapes philippinarum]